MLDFLRTELFSFFFLYLSISISIISFYER